VLEKIADYLESQVRRFSRQRAGFAEARENGLSEAMLDRLALTPARLKASLTMFVRSAIWLTR
jgi:glutamate-5-semialdehyde dehydrogenase